METSDLDPAADFKSCRENIPREFPDILKELTREILLAQPSNIYGFAADYFDKKASDSCVIGGEIYTFDDAALHSHLSEKFRAADSSNRGTLDRKSFLSVLENLDLELTQQHVIILCGEAEANDKGELPYKDLLPNIVALTKEIMVSKQRCRDSEWQALTGSEYIIRGISKVEFEETLRDSMKKFDTKGTGSMNLEQLATFLRESTLNLSRSWRNMVWMQAQVKDDGLISMDDLVSTFHTVFTVLVCEDVANMMRAELVQDLPDKLLTCCRNHDPDNTGLLRPNQLVSALCDAGLGISLFQILSVVSEAKIAPGQEDTCAVRYESFAADEAVPIIAKLIMEDTIPVPKEDALTKEQLDSAAMEAQVSLGMSPQEFVTSLNAAFAGVDSERTGRLSAGKLKETLSLSALGFTQRQVLMFLAMAAVDAESGQVVYDGLAERAIQLMLWEARLERIYDIMEHA